MGKLLGRIWVTGTLLLISFIGFTSQLFIILPSYEYHYRHPQVVTLLVPFNALLALLYWNYALTVRTNPGSVPKGWEPDWNEMETGRTEVKKLTGGPRFCRTCRAYKPPRTHHCRQCKQCRLKMDHHCPWVNNCVGHHNYGHFVRFLFYVDIACSYHLWMVTKRAFGLSAFQRAPTTFQVIMLILNYTACVPVLLIVGVFSLFHCWSILTNTTTIEGWEKDKAASLKRRGKIREYRYPYHLGYLNNLKDVLGPNILFWPFPQRAPGDGLRYRVGDGIDPREQWLWPPRDEFIKPRPRKPVQSSESPFTYGTGLNPLLTRTASSTASYRTAEPSPHMRRRSNHRSVPSTSSRHSRSSSRSSRSTSSSPSVILSDYDDVSIGARRQLNDSDDDDVPLGTLAEAKRGNRNESLRNHPISTMSRDQGDELVYDGQDRRDDRDESADGDEDGSDDEEDEDLDAERSVRIRRGSEGYEIRPRFEDHLLYDQSQHDEYRGRDGRGENEWEEVEGNDRDEREEEGDPYSMEMVSEGELDEDGDRRRIGSRYKYYVREEDSESDTEDETEIEQGDDQ